MLKVANKKCIQNLSRKSLKASRARNWVAIIAIALTTILFTALFTIGMTIVSSYEQQNFRQVGGDMHGTFKDLTEEQMLELADDPLIVKTATRLMLGMPTDPPFNKAHIEVSYMDENCAKGGMNMPTTGALPREGTKEIACDTRILKLLGVEPKLGATVEMPFDLSETDKRKDTFTLSGWWEYDSAGMASMAILPRSYVEEQLKTAPADSGYGIGKWSLNVYFKNTNHIKEDLLAVLENHGYQNETAGEDNYIKIGVNWAYTGAQFAANADPTTMIAIIVLLLIFIFTGYLIIYNIFQISVTNDIRFYGLLKTIGTTGRQIRRIIRRQALYLSITGIPIGLLIGWVCGTVITPMIMKNLSYTVTHVTANPIIFIGATLFSLITVLISCRKPGRIAGRVSPVEAVRYTEGANAKQKKKIKQGQKGAKIPHMAFANLGRNRLKTVLVIVSLSLAVVLMQVTYTFANGFDMDKYLRNWVVTDFILGNADYFQTGGGFASEDQALPEDAIDTVTAKGDVTEGGRIYGQTTSVQEFVSEEWFRQMQGRWNSPEVVDRLLEDTERGPENTVADRAQLYGMEKLPLDRLDIVAGDLAPLYDPSQNAIAAVYETNDYNEVYDTSHWAKIGDEVTLRYVDEYEYYDVRTGEVMPAEEIEAGFVGSRAVKYHDVTYTVAACVTMQHAMSYRYSGADAFVLNSDVFQRDTGTSNIMTYLFNTTPESNAEMEAFLKDYTENIDPLLDYESKQSYVDEFHSFRSMFLMLGSILSLVIGLVGVLNFFNAILTGILTRRREFAVLQAVGMTGQQLRRMLIYEGLCYAGMAVAVSLVLSLVLGPLLQTALGSTFWFFTYRFSILPVACIAPVFLLLGALLPLITHRFALRQSIVDRIRAEGE
ncbi:ABC transporter permease [Butyricicoccus faecihominis]|uniref:ABC transporter permease n=1 Tax=Butyricicoccus faecihominis TaxID=1712515 RepID=UPI00247B1E31|nr:ABC transporter permease [Butyricicoccus faecihominis]MCQ5130418.1 ABC transporter permease [Butyricicoccus faecihominis]